MKKKEKKKAKKKKRGQRLTDGAELVAVVEMLVLEAEKVPDEPPARQT